MRLNPDVPAELEHIINKALEKDRELRYQNAAEMRADLQRLKRDTESGRSAARELEASRWTGPAPELAQSRCRKSAHFRPVLGVAILAAGGLYYRSHRTQATD